LSAKERAKKIQKVATEGNGIRMETVRVLTEAGLLAALMAMVVWVSRRRLTKQWEQERMRLQREKEQYLARLQRIQDTFVSQQSMFFSFHKAGGDFVHTSCYGKLWGRVQPDSVVGKTLSQFLSPAMEAVVRPEYERAWNEGTALQFEVHSSSDRHYLCILSPVVQNGKVMEVAGFVFDITAQKSVETSLMQSEQRYHRLVEMSPEGIAVLRGRKLVFVNPAAVNILGAREASDLVGTSIVSFIHPSDLESVRAMTMRLRRERQVVDLGETRIVRLDGKVIDVEVVGVGIRYEQKPAIQLMFRDITLRKQAEELLQRAKTSAIVGEIAAGIAHEIRNPLTVLRGFTQFLQENDDRYEEYYRIMLAESDKINTIVTELLTLSSLTSMPVQVTDLKSLLDSVVEGFAEQCAAHGISIEQTYVPGCPRVECNPDQLKRAFTNILQNACDAMQDGGMISVGISAFDSEDVTVEIADNGPGIAPDRLSVLGQPHYAMQEKGIGLGLMISYHIVHQYGGTIRIESQVGEGTRVIVRLPVAVNLQHVGQGGESL
jgi:PAS domain S-box-containing protein